MHAAARGTMIRFIAVAAAVAVGGACGSPAPVPTPTPIGGVTATLSPIPVPTTAESITGSALFRYRAIAQVTFRSDSGVSAHITQMAVALLNEQGVGNPQTTVLDLALPPGGSVNHSITHVADLPRRQAVRIQVSASGGDSSGKPISVSAVQAPCSYTLTSLRDQISLVPQHCVLFHGTVRENIAYGKPWATREEIINAARLANAHEFIEKMPRQYETIVGERGDTLSGGQLQRIAIARAVIRNTPILLLDEPSSALDADSEELVFDALARLMCGKTSITVAHRLATARRADRIYVLDDGAIVESGTHDDLLAMAGVYARLYDKQVGVRRMTANVIG